MQSKMTKFAVAAVIIIAVALSLTFLDKSATDVYALEKVFEATKNTDWMHAVVNSKRADIPNSESWISFTHGFSAQLDENGKTSFSYKEKNECYSYDPKTGTITLTIGAQNEVYDKAESPCELLDFIIQVLRDNEGAKVTTVTELRDGKKVVIYEVTVPRGEPLGSLGTEIWRFTVDKKTSLILRMEVEGHDEKGQFIEVIDASIDYPDTGPMSIYDLGVPRDAEVIDMLPGVGIQELAGIFNEKRERFSPYIFVCIETSQGFIYVNHIKGDTFDVARNFKYIHYNYWIPNNNICDEIEERVFEFVESLHKRSDSQLVSAKLWDGKKLHHIDCSEWFVRKSREPGNIRSVGHFWPISGLADKIIEDDYSKSHNLVAVKTGRILRYFDPLHDYVCVRYESKIEDGKVLLREMTDLVQTEEGYWYPRREKGIVIEFDENGEEISREQTFEHIYYVEKMEDLPKEFFDAEDNISRILKRN